MKSRKLFIGLLISSSVFMFVSLFFSTKIASIGLLQYFLVTMFTLYKATTFTPM